MAKSIFIIDDNISLRNALREIFEDMNYEVYLACDGNENMDSFRRITTDIVVTDMDMPEKDDLETMREIKKKFPEAKVIVMSGIYKGNGDFFQVARFLGAIACMRKTF
ncbi:MAG: response regulator [Dissulfurispiraceae bacterium]